MAPQLLLSDTSFLSMASAAQCSPLSILASTTVGNRTGFTFTESTAHLRGILASRLRFQLLIRILIYVISYLSPFHTLASYLHQLLTSVGIQLLFYYILCPSPSNTNASYLRHQLLVFVVNRLQHQPSSPSDTTFCLDGIPASSLRRILASYLQYQLHISVFWFSWNSFIFWLFFTLSPSVSVIYKFRPFPSVLTFNSFGIWHLSRIWGAVYVPLTDLTAWQLFGVVVDRDPNPDRIRIQERKIGAPKKLKKHHVLMSTGRKWVLSPTVLWIRNRIRLIRT